MNHSLVHDVEDLIKIFKDCFYQDYNTLLLRGGEEPIYLPSNESRPYHAIYFAHGYFTSALHECSHWLIAGESRRQLIDFGYWYTPDGRTEEQQAKFELVEVKPQALEWILTKASGHRFRISADNLNGEAVDSSRFKEAVLQQVHHYCETGLPERAHQFREALSRHYGQGSLCSEDFSLMELDSFSMKLGSEPRTSVSG